MRQSVFQKAWIVSDTGRYRFSQQHQSYERSFARVVWKDADEHLDAADNRRRVLARGRDDARADFLLAVHMALTQSRATTSATIAGVGTLGWGFAAAPRFYWAVNLSGGAYLVWLGTRLLWRSMAVAEADDVTNGLSTALQFRIDRIRFLATLCRLRHKLVQIASFTLLVWIIAAFSD